MKMSAIDVDAVNWRVVDAATGEPIDHVVWADDTRGRFIRLRTLPDGSYDVGPLGHIRCETVDQPIRFVRVR